MSNAELGAICLLVMVMIVIITQVLWSEANEEINSIWDRYEQDDWRKFK